MAAAACWLTRLLVAVAVAVMAPLVAGTIPTQRTPIMGFSTWNYFASDINEEIIMQVADALAENLASKGYVYVNIDDAWGAYNRNSTTGRIDADAKKFPRGMKFLADYVHSKGLKFGLYTARYNRTCGGNMPGSLGHELLDAQTFASYGADWLKNDDCRVIYANAFQDYGAMEKALATVDRPILHNVKAPDLPWWEAPKVAQFRRVAKDLKNTWQDFVRVLDTGLDEGFASVVGQNFFNDFDMLEVGNTAGPAHKGDVPMTLTEWQAHFSLWAALKSPLQLGNDPRKMTQEVLEILGNEEVIAVNQDPLAAPVARIKYFDGPRDARATTKTFLAPCDTNDPWQRWHIESSSTNDNKGVEIHSHDGRCLEIWNCRTRWPWWITVSPCASKGHSVPEDCRDTSYQTWTMNASASWIISDLRDACWGGMASDTPCCLSAEQSNPEVDQCGWMVNATRQQWKYNAGTGQIISGMNGKCLALNGNIEVYAGPLSAQGASERATILFLNRSPSAANVTFEFSSLPFWKGSTTAHVRDIIAHKDLGTMSSIAIAGLEGHAVRHFVITQASE